jgi:AcrR family transcriptional regulator
MVKSTVKAQDPGRAKERGARVMGRPRRLTLRTVVEAASKIGLEELSISGLAARLGVGVATIYTYVESRDELLRLVAVQRAWRPHLLETHQHWSEIVRAHAAEIFALFSGEPELLAQVVSGALGPEEELDEIENFLKLLIARDFTSEAAFMLYRAATQIGIGAAIGSAMALNWQNKGERRRVKLARAFAERDPDEFPHLRQLGAAYVDDARFNRYDDALTLLLTQVAAARGEILPSAGDGNEPAAMRRHKA